MAILTYVAFSLTYQVRIFHMNIRARSISGLMMSETSAGNNLVPKVRIQIIKLLLKCNDVVKYYLVTMPPTITFFAHTKDINALPRTNIRTFCASTVVFRSNHRGAPEITLESV